MSTGLSAADLFGLFTHFLVLSLLAVGGAITTVPIRKPPCCALRYSP